MPSPEIISRKEARAAGLKRYFTGKPCKHGHISERFTFQYSCIACTDQWQIDNAETYRASIRSWETANNDRLAATKLAYRLAHVDRKREVDAAWRAANLDRKRLSGRAYSKATYHIRKAYVRAWHRAHPERTAVWTEQRRARRLGAEGHYTHADVAVLKSRQRSRCAWCRASIATKFHVDHIMPLVLGGSNWPRNLQLLCQRCNCSKGGKHPVAWANQQGLLV